MSRLGLFTGQVESGLCPIRNQSDHFGFPTPRPAADRWTELVWVVGYSLGTDRSLVGFELWENLLNFAKSHRIWRDLTGSWRDLGIDEISLNLFEFRLDLDRSDRKHQWTIIIDGERRLFDQYMVKLVEIGFLASDPPTDPLFSGSKGRDSPLTVTDVGSTGSRAGSNGLGWWVKFWFCLDTPSLDGSHILMFMLSYRLT